MFLDFVTLYAKSGDGGNGHVGFRREKYIPFGGPDGGDGGMGGNVIVKAKKDIHSLIDYRFKHHFRAQNGGKGGPQNRSGHKGEDILLKVPVGTIIKDKESGEILADLDKDGMEILLLEGGRGGKGNAFFKTSVRQTPKFAQEGELGQERWLAFELKLIADIGVIGFPNAGKSTFLATVTKARPKIGDYPFTTIHPNLGVLSFDETRCLILADIPGLIEGASEGKGLGHYFLKHVERTRLLLHLIDLCDPEEKSVEERYRTINAELGNYSEKLQRLPQVVALTKTDIVQDESVVEEAKAFFKKEGVEVFCISSVAHKGMKELTGRLLERYTELQTAEERKENGDEEKPYCPV